MIVRPWRGELRQGWLGNVRDDFVISSRREKAMLGLVVAPATAPKTDLNPARLFRGTVTQTEQKRESSASPLFYGNGATKFRKLDFFLMNFRSHRIPRGTPLAIAGYDQSLIDPEGLSLRSFALDLNQADGFSPLGSSSCIRICDRS